MSQRNYKASEDNALSDSSQCSIKIKKLLQDMQEFIDKLQAMHDYAHDKHYDEIEKHLNKVLVAFNELQEDSSAKIMSENKKITTVEKLRSVNKRIEKVKSALADAKAGMQHSDSNLFFSSLRGSTSQLIYENSKNFLLPRNKFEIFIDDFEKIYKKSTAKNSSQFFQDQTPESAELHSKIAEKKPRSR